MLSSYDLINLNRLEEAFLNPDTDEGKDDNELWLEADRRSEEKWAEHYLTS